MNLAQVYPNVRQHLENWSGYHTLADALKLFPDLEVFLAGGVVRNCLLEASLPPKDFDFFLRGPSVKQAITHFAGRGTLETTPYGAPRWHPFERGEQYADLMSIEGFVPGLWQCEDIVDVLNQFDFTANALAFNVRTGASFDPQNGVRDTLRRTMRMVRFDYPERPFISQATLSRNAVLWFRILHYAAALNFAIEPFTLEWLQTHRTFGLHEEEFRSLFFLPHPLYLEPLNVKSRE